MTNANALSSQGGESRYPHTGISTFTFPTTGTTVRALEIDGDPWFVAKDVAETLGYSNPRKAVADHCKAAQVLTSRNVTFAVPNRGLTIIPERDVYRLIMRSKLPAAEAFEDWVVGTVLPSIRKHGGYVKGQEALSEGAVAALHQLIQDYALPVTRYIDDKTEWSIDKQFGRISDERRKLIMDSCIESAAKKFNLPVFIVEKIVNGGPITQH